MTTETQVALRQPTEFEAQLASYEPQIAAALPSHIPLARFKRVVLTAVNNQPELVKADRRSLFNSCVRAANDGLLPDGREAALVIFGGKVQYMPMIQGILKRARNTGELASASANIVYEKDRFSYALGDEEHIIHEPYIGPDRGKPVGAYAIAKLKDGMVQREFMSVTEIEKVRAVSRAKNAGPWVSWWSEMARKTVARRLFKWLPTSADLTALFDRDETMGGQEVPKPIPPRPTRAQYIEGQSLSSTVSLAPAELAPQSETAEEPYQAEQKEEPATFTLTSSTGEVLAETQDGEMWARGVLNEISRATTPRDLEAVWEGNSPQLERLPAAAAQALRDDHTLYASNLAAIAKRKKETAA